MEGTPFPIEFTAQELDFGGVIPDPFQAQTCAFGQQWKAAPGEDHVMAGSVELHPVGSVQSPGIAGDDRRPDQDSASGGEETSGSSKLLSRVGEVFQGMIEHHEVEGRLACPLLVQVLETRPEQSESRLMVRLPRKVWIHPGQIRESRLLHPEKESAHARAHVQDPVLRAGPGQPEDGEKPFQWGWEKGGQNATQKAFPGDRPPIPDAPEGGSRGAVGLGRSVEGVILLPILQPRVIGYRMKEEGIAFRAFQIGSGRQPGPSVPMEGHLVSAKGTADLTHEAYGRVWVGGGRIELLAGRFPGPLGTPAFGPYQGHSPVGRRVSPTVQLVTSTVRRSPGRFVPFWNR